jgi:glycerol uptake facilitator-like aquaporin
MKRQLWAEAIGSFFLFATVIGSGVMAERLAGGNVAIALLGNTIATAAILYVLIAMLGPISGAHFNPAVSLVMRLRAEGDWRDFAARVAVQIAAGVAGVWAAHAMFGLPILQLSQTAREGPGQWLAEFIATFGLLLTILLTVRHRPESVPISVALYIAAAYWFTASTSFANPAITIARSLSDSFAGIAPASVLGFVLAQITGALAAHGLDKALWPSRSASPA